jgi:hypothetical protein
MSFCPFADSRLARRGGVKRIRIGIYDTVRAELKAWLYRVCCPCVGLLSFFSPIPFPFFALVEDDQSENQKI